MHLTASFRPTIGLAVRAFYAAHPLILTVLSLFLPIALAESIVIDDYTVTIAGAAPLLVLLALIGLQVRRMGRRQQSIDVTMTDTDYQLTQGDKTIAISWTNFRTARPRAGVWVLRCSPAVATTLPAHALDPAQTAIFLGFLQHRGLLSTNPASPVGS